MIVNNNVSVSFCKEIDVICMKIMFLWYFATGVLHKPVFSDELCAGFYTSLVHDALTSSHLWHRTISRCLGFFLIESFIGEFF